MKSELLFFDGDPTQPHKAEVELLREEKVMHLTFENGFILPIPLIDLKIKYEDRFTLKLQFKADKNRTIEIYDPIFASTVKAIIPPNTSAFQLKMPSTGNNRYVGIVLGIISLLLLFYFLLLPFLAEKAVVLLPESADKKLGENLYETIEQTEKFDVEAGKVLTQFAATFYPEGKNKFQFEVVEKDELNAFALPDGHIIVYSELLRQMENETQLAGLLSHEMAHVEHRHSMRMVCKSLSGSILLMALFHDANGVIGAILNNAQGLQQLSYSRGYETEADLSGFELLKKKQLDPQGIVSLFEILQQEDQGEMPGFFSTHPLTPDRINYLKEEIKKNPYAVKKNEKLTDLFEALSDLVHLENLQNQ